LKNPQRIFNKISAKSKLKKPRRKSAAFLFVYSNTMLGYNSLKETYETNTSNRK